MTPPELPLHACDPTVDRDGYDGCAYSCCATGPCKCPPDTPADERCPYRTVVVDPPWHYERGKWVANGKFRNDGLPYDTMTLDAIKALEIPAADDAHLYLWTTNRYLRDAFDVAAAWGFRFSTLLTWCKPIHGVGPGGAFTVTTEYLLFCRRGSLPNTAKLMSTWFEAPRGRHSEKPDAFMDYIEQVSPGPYLEMFSRRSRMGWDTWGNESLMGGVA